jgi:hypothetical protein
LGRDEKAPSLAVGTGPKKPQKSTSALVVRNPQPSAKAPNALEHLQALVRVHHLVRVAIFERAQLAQGFAGGVDRVARAGADLH